MPRKKYPDWMSRDGFITQALRRVWLRCKERAFTLKREKYCCEECGRKQSKAKGKEVRIHVHHKKPPNWERIRSVIREELLHPPNYLKVLCKECHDKVHGKVSRK